MNGVDHVEPQPVIPMLVDRLSSVAGQRATHSTLPAYVAAVRSAVDRTASNRAGDRRRRAAQRQDYANLLPGRVLGARLYQAGERAGPDAARDTAPSRWPCSRGSLGARYPAEELRHAWKTLLQNHPHDSICGCSIDAVHEENMTRFARAEQVGDAVVEHGARCDCRAVAGRAAGHRLRRRPQHRPRERAQVVEAFIDLPYRQRRAMASGRSRMRSIAPVAFWPRDAASPGHRHRMGCPSSFRCSAKSRSSATS